MNYDNDALLGERDRMPDLGSVLTCFRCLWLKGFPVPLYPRSSYFFYNATVTEAALGSAVKAFHLKLHHQSVLWGFLQGWCLPFALILPVIGIYFTVMDVSPEWIRYPLLTATGLLELLVICLWIKSLIPNVVRGHRRTRLLREIGYFENR